MSPMGPTGLMRPMHDTFSDLERQVLTRIQWDFPLCSEPYAALARELGVSPDVVHGAISRLRECGVIRRIGGSFAPRRLGYVSVLVAVRVAPPQLEAVARCAAAFPEVTHNYEREGVYNLWFTVIAETQAQMAAILDEVRRCDGVAELYPLPALKTFKIRVNFDLNQPPEANLGTPASTAAVPVRPPCPHGGVSVRSATSTVSRDPCVPPAPKSLPVATPEPDTAIPVEAEDRRLIQRCCGDIGDAVRPFLSVAAELGMNEDDVLRRLQAYKDSGALRRFGAVLRHQAAGYVANGMSGWNVPDADVDRVGGIISACRKVSHCYERPRVPDWPYNVYGMIHGASRDECLATAAQIARDTGITDYQVLFSLREFKKTSMVYLGL